MRISNTPPRETSIVVKSLKILVQFIKPTSNASFDDGTEDSLSLDETIDLLASARRRAVINRLAEMEQRRISIAELAEDVACVEYKCDPSDLTSKERKRVYIALQQSHLPRLTNANVVISDDTFVAPGPQFEHIWRAYESVLDTLS